MATTEKRALRIRGTAHTVEFQAMLERAEFVKRLRQAREAAGLTQEAAARELGVSGKTVWMWEKLDGHVPRPRYVSQMAELYGVSGEYLNGPMPNADPITDQLQRIEAMLTALLAHEGVTVPSLVDEGVSGIVQAIDEPKASKAGSRRKAVGAKK